MPHLFMEDTEKSAESTAGEILQVLKNAKVEQIAQEFRDGQVVGVAFLIRIGAEPRSFKLPANIDPIFDILQGRRPAGKPREKAADYDRAKAIRVAWRQLLRWIQAQVAMIECGMVKTEEVFMPYMIVKGGKTMFQAFEASGLKALHEPPKK